MKDIERKRTEAMFRITRTAIGTALGGAVPAPALEIAKEIGIAVADAWLFYDIYRIYNDEPLDPTRLREMLGTAGTIVLTGGAISYVSLKIGQGVLNELLNAVPILGWSVRGVMTGATTVTIGIAWLAYVDDNYRRTHQQAATVPVPQPVAKRVEVPVRTPAARSASSTRSVAVAEDDAVDVDDVEPEPEADQTVESTEPNEMMTTEHPDDKPGSTIPEVSYQLVRNIILDTLRGQESVQLKTIMAEVEPHAGELDKSVRWYVTTVKLDLEARGIIERVDGVSPQELRLIDKS